MNSTRIQGNVPSERRCRHMSYMHGAHMGPEAIYFGGDQRQVPGLAKTGSRAPPPAWLVADWIMAKKRGEPLTPYAQAVLHDKSNWNAGLLWLDTWAGDES